LKCGTLRYHSQALEFVELFTLHDGLNDGRSGKKEPISALLLTALLAVISSLGGLSALPTLNHQICCVIDVWQQCGRCGAAFDVVTTKVGFGPEAVISSQTAA
jgi:hypothetical protein